MSKENFYEGMYLLDILSVHQLNAIIVSHLISNDVFGQLHYLLREKVAGVKGRGEVGKREGRKWEGEEKG